jgi:hypothetical protein
MVTSEHMTLSRSGFVRQIRSSFWTSPFSAALGEQFADHANVLISGVGFLHTGIRAVRFSGQQLPTTHPMRCSTCFVALRHSVGSSRRQKILDHPGIVLNEPIGALAHLQIGRAYAIQGDAAKARTAYHDFLTLWKDADPGIPILITAKSEYVKSDNRTSAVEAVKKPQLRVD